MGCINPIEDTKAEEKVRDPNGFTPTDESGISQDLKKKDDSKDTDSSNKEKKPEG